MEDMYKNTELEDMVCCYCGSEFKGYKSQATSRYKEFCSLECECKNSTQKKYSYELSNLILEYSFENPYKSTRDIGKVFGVSKDMVTNLIKKYGNRKPKKLIEFNRHYFEKVDTEDKAYWLGFLYADGSVSLKGKQGTLEVGLAVVDKLHLYKLCDSMDKERNVSHKIVKLNGKEFEAVRTHFCSYELTMDLIKLGCMPNKSLKLEFPNINQVPKHLLKHFIRGYVDGDGCIGTYNGVVHLSFVGTTNFLNELVGVLNSNVENMGSIRLHKPDKRFKNDITTSYSKTGIKAVEVLDYLYKDATIYLDRKYEKYKEARKAVGLI